MPGDDQNSYLSAEDRARLEIDGMLAAAGWAVQTASTLNLGAEDARSRADRERQVAHPDRHAVDRHPHPEAVWFASTRGQAGPRAWRP